MNRLGDPNNMMACFIYYRTGNQVVDTLTYNDTTGMLNRQYAAKASTIIRDYRYSYDDFRNLASRTVMRNAMPMTETFRYDNLDRLDTVMYGDTVSRMVYDSYGRMTQRTMMDNVVFNNAEYDNQWRPHAVLGADVNSAWVPEGQAIAYTMHDKVRTIQQDHDVLTIDYGYDRQRIGMADLVYSQQTTTSKLYVGSCEFNHGLNRDQRLTYISGPLGVFAVYEELGELYKGDGDDSGDNGGDDPTDSSFTGALYYVYRDHLGSVTAITDATGSVVQELSYDAWGNLRNPNNWSTPFTGTPKFDRGYTGHEHLTRYGLINMNGRVYDPLMCCFLSVDTYVQDPGSAQNFNRYAYCMYNPLKYTDPDGEWFFTFGLDYGKRSDGSYGITGGSLGVNFGIGGFGVHVNWANGLTVGAYGEVGPHIGNAGLTTTFGVDYNFKYQTTTASLSAGYGISYGIGRAGVGVSGSYTWGLPNGVSPWNANVSASLGFGVNLSQFGQMAGLGVSCSYGTQGWNFGAHSYCEVLPLQEKLNRMVNYYYDDIAQIGEKDAVIKVGNNRNLKRIDPKFGTIYDHNGEIFHDGHDNYGITVPGEAGFLFSDGANPPLRNLGSTVYLSRNTVKKMWNGSDYFKEVMLHECQHAVDYYSGECYRYSNRMSTHYMEYRAYWSNYQRTGLQEHFDAAAYHLKYLPIYLP